MYVLLRIVRADQNDGCGAPHSIDAVVLLKALYEPRSFGLTRSLYSIVGAARTTTNTIAPSSHHSGGVQHVEYLGSGLSGTFQDLAGYLDPKVPKMTASIPKQDVHGSLPRVPWSSR